MKVRDIIKLVEANGWYIVTIRGSHRQYKHQTKPGRVNHCRQPEPRHRPRHVEQHFKTGRPEGALR